jgi:sterol desaturase/sphingolipid hydroxylase (fatty acid hydroxylase superfamily)
VNGVVYDVADFLQSHPGGAELLEETLGDDATEAFERGVHNHSAAARDLLPPMRVGVLAGHEGEAAAGQDSEAQRRARQVIDPSRPYTFQVGKLGELYQEWVHTPIHVKEPLVLLGSWMEPFTKVHWWVPLVFWCPAIVAMLAYASTKWAWQRIVPLYVAMALVGWPLLEYCLHRFLYHMHTSSYWGNTAHFLFHGVHHLTPMDKTRLVAPPALAIFISTPLVLAVYALAPSAAFAWTLAAGGFSGYLLYDMSHYAMHHADLPFEFLRRLRAHHMAHHYGHFNENFGVSNTWTDVLIGSEMPRDERAK